jgi:ribosome-associated protein
VNGFLGHNLHISPSRESPIPSPSSKKSSVASKPKPKPKAAAKDMSAAAKRKKSSKPASDKAKKTAATGAKVATKPVKKPAAKPEKKALATKKSVRTTPTAAFEALQRLIVTALDANKGEEIVTIDLAGKSSFADAMIIASGRSARHVMSLAHHVSDALKHAGYPTPPAEGKESGDWVLLDAGDVIVHLFRPEVRQFYNLEKMWSLPAVPESVS